MCTCERQQRQLGGGDSAEDLHGGILRALCSGMSTRSRTNRLFGLLSGFHELKSAHFLDMIRSKGTFCGCLLCLNAE